MAPQVSDEVKYSAYGARAFYFITYGLFYCSVFLYPSPLSKGSWTWRIIYTLMHLTTIWLFLTTADNPGYALPEDEKEPNLLCKKDDDSSLDTVNSDEVS